MTDIKLLIGETLSGRITHTLEGNELPTSLRWTDVLNGTGSIEGVTIPKALVEKYNLRQHTHDWRCFLAVEVDGRIKQAGPITTATYDWRTSQLTLGAQGIWAYFDRRVVRPAVVVAPYATNVFTVSGKSLGGIARALVERALTQASYTAIPIVLPPDEAGIHTESFPAWAVQWCGEELRQLTQRATDAPDIRFQARRRGDDPRYIEWPMLVGTEINPTLSQGGPDWVFDTSAPQSPVLGIGTDRDGTGMAQQVYMTGNGMEEDLLFTFASDATLVTLPSPWPLTEMEGSRPTVEDIDVLYGHALNLLQKADRPVEAFKLAVRSGVVNEVNSGDFVRLVTKGDVWLGDLDRVMRVKQIAGDLSDTVTLEMFPVEAVL